MERVAMEGSGAGSEAPRAAHAAPAAGGLGLTGAERHAWAEDGFFVRERLFSPDEVEELRRAAEEIVLAAAASAQQSEQRYAIDGNQYVEASIAGGPSTVQLEHAAGSRTIRVIEPFHHLHPRFGALVDDARLVEPMKGLVGCERVALFTDKLNLKRPREGSRFSWHQDSPYWAHFCQELERLPNVLVALDDADESNGCFRVVRGSHRRGMLPGRQGEGVLGPLFTHPDHVDLSQQVATRVPAGSAVFFSPHTVHGSEPNLSDRPRRALVLTYQPGGRRMFKLDAVRDTGAAGR